MGIIAPFVAVKTLLSGCNFPPFYAKKSEKDIDAISARIYNEIRNNCIGGLDNVAQ